MYTSSNGNILNKSFSISREQAAVADPAILMALILRETGSEDEAKSILRTLERMGRDPSILTYDMTLETRRSRTTGLKGAWRVRAYRGEARSERNTSVSPPTV